MEKIFEVNNYEGNSWSIKPIKNIRTFDISEEIYKAAKRDGSEGGYVVYISKQELTNLLDKEDGR